MNEAFYPRGERTEYKKYDGNSTSVTILNEVEIANGDFGIIYLSDVLTGNKKRKVIIKKFTNEGIFDHNAAKNAEKAFSNYMKAKKAGLKVLPTYRIGDDRTSILMTNCVKDNTVVLSNNSSLKDFGLSKIQIEFPEQFIDLAEKMTTHAKLAQSKGIELPNDSYFFLFDTVYHQLDFVIGDFDCVRSSDEDTNNISSARIALIDFFNMNILNPDSYIDRINQTINQYQV